MAVNNPPYPSTDEILPQHPDSLQTNTTMTRYESPQQYPPPPPPPRRISSGYKPDTRPRGPSLLNQQIPSIPPVPQNQAYGPPAIVQTPPASQPAQYQHQPQSYQDPHRPSLTYADCSSYQQYSSSPNANSSYVPLQPSSRRLSASSAHSRHSHDGYRSDHSRPSSSNGNQGRRHSYKRDDYYDDEDAKTRKHHHSKHSKDKEEHRPTLGDTVYSVFGYFKNSLVPSDKH